MTTITFAIAQLCATDDCCDACGEDILSGVCVFYKDGDGCFQLHPGCITPGDPVLDKAVESARLIVDGDKAEFLTAKVANADAELARLRAALAEAEQSVSLARTDQATAERARDVAERERDEARKAHAAMQLAYEAVTGLTAFDPLSELNQLRASNHYMLDELTRLRAERGKAGKE